MDKRILFFFLLFAQTAFAQIPNGGFESWSNGNPDSWQTTNIPIFPHSILPDTDAYNGSVALKGIVVSNNYNQPFPPYLAISGSGALGFSISNKFEIAGGWYKLSLMPGDKFIADVRMYNSQSDLVAEGSLISDGCYPDWSPFFIQMYYTLSSSVATCTMYFTITDSTGLSSGQIGSYFILDDLTMTGTAGTNEQPDDENISVFPNPAGEELNVNIPKGGNEIFYSLNDITGKVVKIKNHCMADEKISLENISPGIYFLNVISDENRFVKKLVIE